MIISDNLSGYLLAHVIPSSRIDFANKCVLVTMFSILLCVNILVSCMFSLVSMFNKGIKLARVSAVIYFVA